jgi:hypothetical protein
VMQWGRGEMGLEGLGERIWHHDKMAGALEKGRMPPCNIVDNGACSQHSHHVDSETDKTPVDLDRGVV